MSVLFCCVKFMVVVCSYLLLYI